MDYILIVVTMKYKQNDIDTCSSRRGNAAVAVQVLLWTLVWLSLALVSSYLVVGPCCHQELGIAFDILSVSESNRGYRKFLEVNFGDRIRHMFEDFQDQIDGKPCLLHQGQCLSCTGCGNSVEPADLAVLGTPCRPFSRQRTKRWANGSVQSHQHFKTTFSTAYNFLEVKNPQCCILEQVEGFDAPFSSEDPVTPKQRQGFGSKSLHTTIFQFQLWLFMAYGLRAYGTELVMEWYCISVCFSKYLSIFKSHTYWHPVVL